MKFRVRSFIKAKKHKIEIKSFALKVAKDNPKEKLTSILALNNSVIKVN
jgi:hypothetical protein